MLYVTNDGPGREWLKVWFKKPRYVKSVKEWRGRNPMADGKVCGGAYARAVCRALGVPPPTSGTLTAVPPVFRHRLLTSEGETDRCN